MAISFYKTMLAAALLMPLSAMALKASDGTVHLHGQLVNLGRGSVVMAYDGAASMVGGSRDITLRTDAQGYFDTTLVIKEPTYYNINRNTLYLSPGDDLTIRIAQSNHNATFSGRGAQANNYMKERLFPKAGSYINGGSNLRHNFAQTRQLIDSIAAVRRHELDTLTGVSRQFKIYENARIDADIINSYVMFPQYAGLIYNGQAKTEQVKPQDFYPLLTSSVKPLFRNITHDSLLDVAAVRRVVEYVVNPEIPAIKEWAEGLTITSRMRELYSAADMAYFLRQKADSATLQKAQVLADNLKNKDFAAELKAKISQDGKLGAGQPAIDFAFADKNGKSAKLSDYKGKVIYIDFWATWCGPCIKEAPAFEALEKDFRGKDVVFLSVSTDQTRDVWLRYLQAHNKQGLQVHSTDGSLHTGWAIYYIPRFVAIDKDFRIADAYAPRPSQPEARALLESLLK